MTNNYIKAIVDRVIKEIIFFDDRDPHEVSNIAKGLLDNFEIQNLVLWKTPNWAEEGSIYFSMKTASYCSKHLRKLDKPYTMICIRCGEVSYLSGRTYT